MGLFDFLSGSDEAEQAAAANRAALAQYGGQTTNLYNQYRTGALDNLGEARAGALGSLNTGLQGQLGAYGSGLGALQGTTTAPLQSALSTLQGVTPQALQDAIRSQQQGLGAIQSGAQNAVGAGQAAIGAYAPLSQLGQSYGGATTALLNALGVNGADARNASLDQFRNTPGYQFQQQEALRGATNAASRLGIAGSGNTLQAISDRAGNIADTSFNQNYLQPLSQFINPALQATSGAASGIAGANTNLANIYRQGGADIATGYGNVANAQAGLFGGQQGIAQNVAGAYGNLFAGQRGLGQDTANLYNQIAGAYGQNAPLQAGAYTGYGQDVTNVLGNIAQGQTQSLRDVAQGNIAANNQVAQAGQQDAANLWGLLGSGAKAAGSIFGGGSKSA